MGARKTSDQLETLREVADAIWTMALEPDREKARRWWLDGFEDLRVRANVMGYTMVGVTGARPRDGATEAGRPRVWMRSEDGLCVFEAIEPRRLKLHVDTMGRVAFEFPDPS